MPLYFFHLSFGDRTVPDDEGVELPNRFAAREEALAVIRDLSNPEIAGNPRRWASWFLQVADEGGEFLRLPIGRPALEVVTPDSRQRPSQRWLICCQVPSERIAADLGIGQVAHDCQRLLAGGRSVRQFNPFFVRQDAVAEVEMEEIKRHMTLLDSTRLNPAVRSVWHPRGICLLEPRLWNRQSS